MSHTVDLQLISQDARKKISCDLEVAGCETKYGSAASVLCFACSETVTAKGHDYKLTVPFNYSLLHMMKNTGSQFPNDDITYPQNSEYSFIGVLNTIQREIHDLTFELLDRNRSILISLYCGAGKTIYTIYLVSQLKHKAMVLCHRVNIIDQWVYSIKKVCPDAIVQVLSTTTRINKSADFYIMNASSVCKRDVSDYRECGILVCDEAHVLCTENKSRALLSFSPKYLIALTATPKRTDGMDKILDLHFGTEIISRKLYRPFNAYVYDTHFKPESVQTEQGRLDWNRALESQCLDEDRNDLIVNIVRYFKNRNFLILCKRIDQTNILHEKLSGYDEDVDVFVGSRRVFNYSARILISTYSKTGVGFDHPRLDALIIASDVQEGIEQYVGRVFRREDVVPIVFDLLDKMHTMYRHYKTRKELYESIGGRVVPFLQVFPDFTKWVSQNEKMIITL